VTCTRLPAVRRQMLWHTAGCCWTADIYLTCCIKLSLARANSQTFIVYSVKMPSCQGSLSMQSSMSSWTCETYSVTQSLNPVCWLFCSYRLLWHCQGCLRG
jgi:hypothetical protein